MTFQTIKALLNDAVQTLEQADIEEAKLNVNLIASKILGIEQTKLPFHWSETPSDNFISEFQTMLNRRLKHEPLQYILGEWSFLDFEINTLPGALIPRPETEEVFLAAVNAIKKLSLPPNFNFADVGTGTGILGIAMASYFPESTGKLIDISDEALAIAKSNIERYPELKTRLSLLKSNLLDNISSNSLDVIISNPPYIKSNDITDLMPEVADYEPLLALDGGENGLTIINELLIQAEKVLKNNGLFIFEHGHGQREDLKKIIPACWNIIKEGNDFSNNERFFILQIKRTNSSYEKN